MQPHIDRPERIGSGAPGAHDESDNLGPWPSPVLRAVAWVATAAALGGTFWLYTRPNLLLDLGSFMQMCGFR